MYDFAKKNLQLATSGPQEIWQDHQISRAGGPIVHCLEMKMSSPDVIYMCNESAQLDSAVERDPRSRRTRKLGGVEGRSRGGRLGWGKDAWGGEVVVTTHL